MKLGPVVVLFCAFGVKLLISPGMPESVAFVSLSVIFALQEFYSFKRINTQQRDEIDKLHKDLEAVKADMSAMRLQQGWKNLKNGQS
jgi:hypothetical protein